jgi:hypothetical protein
MLTNPADLAGFAIWLRTWEVERNQDATCNRGCSASKSVDRYSLSSRTVTPMGTALHAKRRECSKIESDIWERMNCAGK